MFDRLFKRQAAVARHSTAPLLSERLRYLEHLEASGTARKTLIRCAHYMLGIGQMFRWNVQGPISEQRIDDAASRWIVRKHGGHRGTTRQAAKIVFASTARGWLRFLGLLQVDVTEQPGAQQLANYMRFMLEERNFSPVTIRVRHGRAAEILRMLAAQGIDPVDVAWGDIDRILATKGRRDGLTRVTMRTYAYDLRSFLRFLEEHGACRGGLAAGVRPVRVYQGEVPPVGPSWDVVGRLLGELQDERSGAIRDRAIIMLFALYGLRAAEVRQLSVDDFDWERALMRVRRSKQSPRVECYPLTAIMKEALAKYLRFVRPKTTRREVFLQLRAPYQPLSNSALWQVVSRRLRPMVPDLRHHGPHALRHACATRLLACGLNMKEIGDFLGMARRSG